MIRAARAHPSRAPYRTRMKQRPIAPRRHAVRITLILAVGVALVGVVMAETHDPIAIEPDAPRKDGAQVATFALG